MSGASAEPAHDVAVHVAFARPKYLTRDQVPSDVVEHERSTLETLSRNEGKPEAALPKIAKAVPMHAGGCKAERELTDFAPAGTWTKLGVTLTNGKPLPATDPEFAPWQTFFRQAAVAAPVLTCLAISVLPRGLLRTQPTWHPTLLVLWIAIRFN